MCMDMRASVHNSMTNTEHDGTYDGMHTAIYNNVDDAVCAATHNSMFKEMHTKSHGSDAAYKPITLWPI